MTSRFDVNDAITLTTGSVTKTFFTSLNEPITTSKPDNIISSPNFPLTYPENEFQVILVNRVNRINVFAYFRFGPLDQLLKNKE